MVYCTLPASDLGAAAPTPQTPAWRLTRGAPPLPTPHHRDELDATRRAGWAAARSGGAATRAAARRTSHATARSATAG